MKDSVKPKDFYNFDVTFFKLFGFGPKITITCGNCENTFEKKLSWPLANNPGINCTYCNTINILPIKVTKEEEV